MCFFQAEDGIRDLVRSRGLGDVYKRQEPLVRVRKEGASGSGLGLAIVKKIVDLHGGTIIALSLIHI